MATVSAVAVIIALGLAWTAYWSEKETATAQWLRICESFAAHAATGLLNDSMSIARHSVELMLAYPDVSQAILFDRDLQPLLSAGEAGETIAPVWLHQSLASARMVHESDRGWYFAAAVTPAAVDAHGSAAKSYFPSSDVLGYAVFAVAKDAFHARLRRRVVIIGAAALAIAGGILFSVAVVLPTRTGRRAAAFLSNGGKLEGDEGPAPPRNAALEYGAGVAEKEGSAGVEAGKVGGLVLVVDDDRITRIAIGSALKREGFEIAYATNGQEAIDRFFALKPDLVIMDALMPAVTGFDACREIIEVPGGKETPILMITSLDHDEAVERAFQAGVVDFITKPINLTVLRRRVKGLLHARRSEERIKQLAFRHALTGLPNRIAFFDRMRQELSRAARNQKQLAVLFIDIDMFKVVNDNLGHAAGDLLLKTMSARLADGIRGEDTLARLGGDEFVVVLGSVEGRQGAETVARHILKVLAEPFRVAGREVHVGASIGIAFYPEDGYQAEELLRNADTAMYRAKANGRNNYQLYTPQMSAALSDRIDLEGDLRRAVEKGELLLYYQPKVALASGGLAGAEALVRWRHPSRGFIGPEAFIGIAEECGIIGELGGWVMGRACAQFRQWSMEADLTGTVAVNISARQFRAPNFTDEVARFLKESLLPPVQLELEITESTILEYEEKAIEKLKILGAMGVRIAIDNYGVGYSSFSYFKDLPVQTLKIDRSFIRDLNSDRAGAPVVAGLIALAHNLNMEVVAEGVETADQYAFLKHHRCDLIQGYLIGHPVAPETFFEIYVRDSQRHPWHFPP